MSQTSVNMCMVRRVAEVIGGGDVLPHHLEKARRVLEAMRQPTEMMEWVGGTYFDEGETANNGRAGGIVYSAMIDAALAAI